MPGERREFHKIRPASHTLLSVNCLYQMNAAERKGVFTKLGRAGHVPIHCDANRSVCAVTLRTSPKLALTTRTSRRSTMTISRIDPLSPEKGFTHPAGDKELCWRRETNSSR